MNKNIKKSVDIMQDDLAEENYDPGRGKSTFTIFRFYKINFVFLFMSSFLMMLDLLHLAHVLEFSKCCKKECLTLKPSYEKIALRRNFVR